MRKGLPFLLLALVIALLVVLVGLAPVGSALPLYPSAPLAAVPHDAWPVVAKASVGSGIVYRAPVRESAGVPDAIRLFLAGTVLVGLGAVARRAR